MRRWLHRLGDVSGATQAAAILTVIGWVGLGMLSGSSELGEAMCRGDTSAGSPVRPDALLAWLFMILAMMGPLLSGPMYHVWHRSLARHRLRGIGLFLLSYVAVWLLVCVLFVLVIDVGYRLDRAPLLPLTLLLAAAWQLSPLKRRALLRCHLRPPLSIFGARALLDPVWFGLRRAAWCVLSCWVLMLVPFVAERGGVALMLIASGIIFAEQVMQLQPRPFGTSWVSTPLS